MLSPKVSVHAVNSSGAVLAANCNSLVKTFLVSVKVFVHHSKVLVFALDNFKGVVIEHLDGDNGGVLIFGLVENCPLGSLLPGERGAQVVLGHQVLICLKSEANHFSILYFQL